MLAVVMGIMIILIAGDTTGTLAEIRNRYFRNTEQMLIATTHVKVKFVLRVWNREWTKRADDFFSLQVTAKVVS
jgi:hypothetical protein